MIQPMPTIEYWDIAKLRPYTRNPRNNDQAVDRMVAAIQEFGFKIPLLVRRDGEIIDGHLRLKAAYKLGMTQVPTLSCDEWTPAQVKAFRLLVNRSVNWAAWDEELLALEIGELHELAFDLSLTGFAMPEIDRLLCAVHPDAEEAPIPEPPLVPVSRSGDLWLCCGHRILCGDATCAADVARLLEAAAPLLMVTDPPYGVEYDPEWREQAGLGQPRQTGTVLNDDRVDWSAAYRLFPGDVLYVWHAGVHTAEVAASLLACGFDLRAQIIWAKQHFVMSRGHYHWQHEPAWYAVRQNRAARWRGDRTQSTLWQVNNLNPFGGDAEEPATGHATQKPVELMRRPILNHTQRGEILYDPFLGSGSTLVAAELTDRICYGLDLSPAYVDVIVTRWQTLTSKPAVLDHDGRTFQQIQTHRSSAPRPSKSN
jgi:DNA modification methylase